MTELEQYMNTMTTLIKKVEELKENFDLLGSKVNERERLLVTAITLLRDEYGIDDLSNKLDTSKETIRQYDTKKRILDTINYSDIKDNYFNEWLTEALDYKCNIVFYNKKELCEEEAVDYKKVFDIRDIDIQFREENNYDDDFDIAVYCKRKGNDEWEYVDNITREFYDRRFE